MAAHKLDLVHLAIRSGVLGHIQWKDSAERLANEDLELLGVGITSPLIRHLLHQFVKRGNILDVRVETREEYLAEHPEDPYWYRAIIPVPGLSHGLFVEVRLVDDDAVEPWVEIVSAHRQQS